MKKIIGCVIIALLISVQYSDADEFRQKVRQAALSMGIAEVHEVLADVKSVKNDKNRITIHFPSYVKLGDMYNHYIEIGGTPLDDRFSIPETARKIRIYWGFNTDNHFEFLAFEDVSGDKHLAVDRPAKWFVNGRPAKKTTKKISHSDRMKQLFHDKTKTAVPDFIVTGGNTDARNAAQKAHELLRTALDLTGYLSVLDSSSLPGNHELRLANPNGPDYEYWKKTGSKFLVSGMLSGERQPPVLRLKMHDVSRSLILVEKTLAGPNLTSRQMIFEFCSDASYMLTGKKALFNHRIAFVSATGDSREIFTCDAVGQDIQQVTSHKSTCLSPAISKDGKWITYLSDVRGNRELFIRHLTAKKGTLITNQIFGLSPEWMPGGAKLATVVDFSGDRDICLFNLRGKMTKRIHDSTGQDRAPSFSPDGKRLAFVSDRKGNARIFVRDLASGKINQISADGQADSPAWSPAGDKIAFAIEKNGRSDIVIVNPDGTDRTQLTQNAGSNRHPSWSPDSNLIVFTSTREQGVSKLHIMTAAGTGQRKLVHMKGSQTEPNWSR